NEPARQPYVVDAVHRGCAHVSPTPRAEALHPLEHEQPAVGLLLRAGDEHATLSTDESGASLRGLPLAGIALAVGGCPTVLAPLVYSRGPATHDARRARGLRTEARGLSRIPAPNRLLIAKGAVAEPATDEP